MNISPTSSKNISPAEFILGCVALFSRPWGLQQATWQARIKAAFPVVLVGLLVIVLCDCFFDQCLWAMTFIGVCFATFILFTFDKKTNNFADRLATLAKQGLLRCCISVITVIPAALAKFSSRVTPVPITPPRRTPA
ncbi:MAG: hypothetical protein Q8J90_04390 [Gallionella sp.]|nr:hypothetical protein [Gallionella sp.]